MLVVCDSPLCSGFVIARELASFFRFGHAGVVQSSSPRQLNTTVMKHNSFRVYGAPLPRRPVSPPRQSVSATSPRAPRSGSPLNTARRAVGIDPSTAPAGRADALPEESALMHLQTQLGRMRSQVSRALAELVESSDDGVNVTSTALLYVLRQLCHDSVQQGPARGRAALSVSSPGAASSRSVSTSPSAAGALLRAIGSSPRGALSLSGDMDIGLRRLVTFFENRAERSGSLAHQTVRTVNLRLFTEAVWDGRFPLADPGEAPPTSPSMAPSPPVEPRTGMLSPARGKRLVRGGRSPVRGGRTLSPMRSLTRSTTRMSELRITGRSSSMSPSRSPTRVATTSPRRVR